jgi:amino acid adenylation domain-containing protein
MSTAIAADVFRFPASIAQRGAWVLDQLAQGIPAYNVTGALRLRGPLNEAALEQSINHIIDRHEVLRTSFPLLGEGLVQIVSSAKPLVPQSTDLRGLDPEVRAAQAIGLATDEARRLFDLARGPLLRARLLRLDEQERILVLTTHHITCDQYSIDIFMQELEELYKASSTSVRPVLPALPVQYADFTLWQEQYLQGQTLADLISFWTQELDGSLPLLELPADHGRPQSQSFQGRSVSFALPASLADSLDSLSRTAGCTLFTTLLAALNVLLYRYTGRQDIVVGSAYSSRDRTELFGLIGFFVNMLVLRTDISGEPRFLDLLGRVRDVTLRAYDHSGLRFEKLLESLSPDRAAGHWPIFQVAFQLLTGSRPLSLAGIEASVLEIDNGTSKFDLNLTMTREPDGLTGSIEYNTDLFEEGRIKRMIGHLKQVLRSISEKPSQRIWEIELLTVEERELLRGEWKTRMRKYRQAETLHEIITEQAEERPEAIALVYRDKQVSYGELNGKANQLAGYLRREGIREESVVGVCMERGVEVIVGLLGIMKAGGAYVPLDPGHPMERLQYVLEQSGARVVVTEGELMEEMGWWSGRVVRVDREREAIGWESREGVEERVGGENLSYVIYTSGSTGQPKGAMLVHRGVRNRLMWGIEDYELGEGDVVLNKTALSFDVSVWEIMAPLMSGGKVVIAEEGGQQDSRYLVELIQEEGVTHMDFVPSMLQLFVEESGVEGCVSIKRVTAAGEALSEELVRRFHEVSGGDLYNLYGPTEASLAVTYWDCKGGEATIPIGVPMDNTRVYIMDGHKELSPLGVAGELYIGGIAPGRGYVKDGRQTAERYVPDANSEEMGKRMYRTGDLARRDERGVIEFLGRVDHQVKVRGIRIELGEIEAVLERHEGIAEAVVMAQEEGLEKRLVAYVRKEKGSEATVEELRSYMREKLPEYMVARVVMLEKMPLTPNGKVDRRSLEAMGLPESREEQEYIEPRSEVEKQLEGIWKELLNVERVSVHSNFFDLGGHSLLGVQLLSRVRTSFDVDLPLRTLFEKPTIAGVSEEIESMKLSTRIRKPKIKVVARELYGAKSFGPSVPEGSQEA